VASGDRPNFLWICTDQQRFDTIGALGNPHLRTPNLDRLVAEGVAFERTYTQSPICTPSRAAFLSGRYPSSIHVNRNGNAFFPDTVPLVTRLLADAGYDCGLAGKLHLSAAEGRVEARPDDGYRFFRWSHHPKPETFWPNAAHAYQGSLVEKGVQWDEAYGGVTEDGSAIQGEYAPGITAEYHQTTWCADEAIRFMTEERTGPWLMSVNPFDPHPPFDPPPEYLSRMAVDQMPLPRFRSEELESQLDFAGVDHQTDEPLAPTDYDAQGMVAAYYAQIELIDDQVGRMLDALESSGQRDNTVVIFCSDHGEMLGDHGLRLKGCRFYEGAVHVPLIVSWPGHLLEGVRSPALVELMDLMPTVLELAGLDPAADLEAQSLLPIMLGHRPLGEHRSFVRCEYHDAIVGKFASHANMIYDGRYKLAVYHGLPIGELYDLDTDPDEFHNLWQETASQAVKTTLLKALFDAVMLCTDPGQPRVGRY